MNLTDVCRNTAAAFGVHRGCTYDLTAVKVYTHVYDSRTCGCLVDITMACIVLGFMISVCVIQTPAIGSYWQK